MFAGNLLPRVHSWTPVEGVDPFHGLPPEGVAASVPDTGELVLTLGARMPDLGYEMQQSYLYADGRLIWQRNLEGHAQAQRIFGDLEPTTAIIEQRLTPEGVALVRAAVLASMPTNSGLGGRPGTRPWGGIEMVIDGRLQEVAWVDADLPVMLADPGTWVPDSAWADRTLRGYVPSRYGVCLGPSVQLSDLPAAAAAPLREQAGFVGPGSPSSIGICYTVPTEVAREIDASLRAADLVRCNPPTQLSYGMPHDPEGRCGYEGISFNELLPHGKLLLRGG